MKMVRCGRCGKSNVEFKATLRYELVGAPHAKCKDVCETCFANFQLWWGAPSESNPDRRLPPKDVENDNKPDVLEDALRLSAKEARDAGRTETDD